MTWTLEYADWDPKSIGWYVLKNGLVVDFYTEEWIAQAYVNGANNPLPGRDTF